MQAHRTPWSIGWVREVVRGGKARYQILQSWQHNLLVLGCDGALSRSTMACTSSFRIFNTSTWCLFNSVLKPVFSNSACELCICRAVVMRGKFMHDVFYSFMTSSLPSNHRLQHMASITISTYERWHSFLTYPQNILLLQYNDEIKEGRNCNTYKVTFLLWRR